MTPGPGQEKLSATFPESVQSCGGGKSRGAHGCRTTAGGSRHGVRLPGRANAPVKRTSNMFDANCFHLKCNFLHRTG